LPCSKSETTFSRILENPCFQPAQKKVLSKKVLSAESSSPSVLSTLTSAVPRQMGHIRQAVRERRR
jgi:hypothetical protein